PSKMPQLVPTQTMLRRPLLSEAKAGYVSSGGGSSDGGFMIAGVDVMIGPSGRLRTAEMTVVASVAVMFISGASVATFAVVKATMVPSGVVVYRFRRFGSVTAVPVGVVQPGPGTQATHSRFSWGPPGSLDESCETNRHPDSWVVSGFGIYVRNALRTPA